MKQLHVLWALVLALLLGGCASLESARTPEEIVAKRAQERWNYLLKAEHEKVYEYLSPGYREVRSYRQYLATLGASVKRVGANVTTVSCESEDVCNVDIEVSYFYGAQGSMAKPGDTPISRISQEKWIMVDGQWWLYKDAK